MNQPTQSPAAESVSLSDAALAEFTEYFVRNYPGPDTIIGNPNWHAPKIFRAAKYAIEREAESLRKRELDAGGGYDSEGTGYYQCLIDVAKGIQGLALSMGWDTDSSAYEVSRYVDSFPVPEKYWKGAHLRYKTETAQPTTPPAVEGDGSTVCTAIPDWAIAKSYRQHVEKLDPRERHPNALVFASDVTVAADMLARSVKTQYPHDPAKLANWLRINQRHNWDKPEQRIPEFVWIYETLMQLPLSLTPDQMQPATPPAVEGVSINLSALGAACDAYYHYNEAAGGEPVEYFPDAMEAAINAFLRHPKATPPGEAVSGGDAKAELWRIWAIDGMPKDKQRLAEAAFNVGLMAGLSASTDTAIEALANRPAITPSRDT